MAFTLSRFMGAMHGAGRDVVFSYLLPPGEDVSDALSSGYFDGAAAYLREGDVIVVHQVGVGPAVAITLGVSDVTAGVVSVVIDDTIDGEDGVEAIKPVLHFVPLPALGTQANRYVPSGVPVGYTGTVTRYTLVTQAADPSSGGHALINLLVPTTGAIAQIEVQDEEAVAGTKYEDATITAHVPLTPDSVLTLAIDGQGNHTALGIATIEVTLARAA